MLTDYIPLFGSLLLFLGTCFGAFKVYQSAKEQNEVQRQANLAGNQNSRYDQLQEDLDKERSANETLRDRVDKMAARMETIENETQKIRNKLNVAMGVIQAQQDHARRAGIVPMEIPAILTTY